MADLVITASNVIAGGTEAKKTAGVAVTAGEVVYLNTSTSKVELANAVTEAAATFLGIATCTVAANQTLNYQDAGSITLGAVLTVGQVYVVSQTSGKIAPYADLVTNDYVTILGVASSTSVLVLAPNITGVQKP